MREKAVCYCRRRDMAVKGYARLMGKRLENIWTWREKFEVTVRHEIGVEEESHCGKVVRSQKILYGIRGDGREG